MSEYECHTPMGNSYAAWIIRGDGAEAVSEDNPVAEVTFEDVYSDDAVLRFADSLEEVVTGEAACAVLLPEQQTAKALSDHMMTANYPTMQALRQ